MKAAWTWIEVSLSRGHVADPFTGNHIGDDRGNFKGGFGIHPMFCLADATGEPLSNRLRPDNASANDTSDPMEVIDETVGQLPVKVTAAHRPGDLTEMASRRIVVHSDSAGEQGFVEGCHSHNLGCQTVARRNVAVSAAVATANIDPGRCQPALNQDGAPQLSEDNHSPSEVCDVCAMTDRDVSDWPDRTRLSSAASPSILEPNRAG